VVSLKVWSGSALKDPDMIIAKGNADTLFEVNYVVVNNSSQNPVTVWQAISQTTRSTTTTFDTSLSTTTTFDTSNATTTTFSTSNATTTSFNTSKSTTTSFNTSRSTTTSFNTSRTTSRTTQGSYGPYYAGGSPIYGWLSYNIWWNGTAILTYPSPGPFIPVPGSHTTGGYTYEWNTSVAVPIIYVAYYGVRRRNNAQSTSFTTTFGTSRSTTTTFGTSRSTTTTFGTSKSTTTTFNTSQSTTTTISTSNSTTTTFSTNNATDTTIFVRLTGTLGGATSTETEVASADATNVRYWDGDSWEED